MMSYLFWSRLIFWSLLVLMFIAAIITTVVLERMERHQQQLAEEHLRKRRIRRFNEISRNRNCTRTH